MDANRGKGKFEFLLVVAIFGVAAAALLNRLIEVEEEAERTEVQLTLRNMRVGLQLAVGERVMRGREDLIPELLAMNPIVFLGHRPAGYRGETAEPGPSGSWRFDPGSRTLIYRPRQPHAFEGADELRWKLATKGERNGRIVGLGLEPVEN